MLKKLTPKKIKALLSEAINLRIDQKIGPVNQRIGRVIQQCVRYVPCYPKLNSYVISASSPGDKPLCELGLPIPPNNIRTVYTDSAPEEYLSGGREQTDLMLKVLLGSGYQFKNKSRILDFGCGEGRQIRWFARDAAKFEVWGCDIDSERIAWCRKNLPSSFNFFTSTTAPTMPIEDNYFDFIYAGSVFTHIDGMAVAWFLELRRILQPKGRLYVTIHDNNSIELLKGKYRDHWVSKFLFSDKDFIKFINSDFEMFSVGRATNPNVFYNIAYLQRILRPFYKVISVTNEAYIYQSALLLEKI